MPECYTHARIATKALMRSGLTVASQPAFLAGANGPDPLYMYKGWRRNPEPNLPALAALMHRERTGDFLVSLVEYAITPLQQSYVLGFLAHYAADCIMNPYLAAMSKKGKPYEGAAGQRRLEASLDSTLYYADYKSYTVPVSAGTPVLISEDLAQVSTMLHDVVRDIYGQDIPALAFADTFHDNLRVRKFLHSRTGLRRGWVRFWGPLYPDKRGSGNVAPRIQPAKPLKRLPEVWTNPYTGEDLDLTLEEILSIAEQTAAAILAAAMHYWLGEIDDTELHGFLHDNNYFTGQPNPGPEDAADDGKADEKVAGGQPEAGAMADENKGAERAASEAG